MKNKAHIYKNVQSWFFSEKSLCIPLPIQPHSPCWFVSTIFWTFMMWHCIISAEIQISTCRKRKNVKIWCRMTEGKRNNLLCPFPCTPVWWKWSDTSGSVVRGQKGFPRGSNTIILMGEGWKGYIGLKLCLSLCSSEFHLSFSYSLNFA